MKSTDTESLLNECIKKVEKLTHNIPSYFTSSCDKIQQHRIEPNHQFESTPDLQDQDYQEALEKKSHVKSKNKTPKNQKNNRSNSQGLRNSNGSKEPRFSSIQRSMKIRELHFGLIDKSVSKKSPSKKISKLKFSKKRQSVPVDGLSQKLPASAEKVLISQRELETQPNHAPKFQKAESEARESPETQMQLYSSYQTDKISELQTITNQYESVPLNTEEDALIGDSPQCLRDFLKNAI